MLKITAHVPCQQFGFIEIEGTQEEALEIERLYNYYAEKPVAFRNGSRKLLKAWVGGEVYYDDLAHKYTNEAGEVYLSGSQYAAQFESPFDTQVIAGKMSTKFNVPAEDIVKMWDMKRDISNGLGTAIHAALELYGKYEKYVDVFDKEYHLHDHPTIKQAVLSFYKDRKEEAIYEALVVDHSRKYAGRIDRVVKEKDLYFIEDFKTNAELKSDKLKNYWKQLSFYASIVEASGNKIGGLRIHHWNGGEWTTHEHKAEEVK
jgi:hypothetical protein